MMRLPPFEDARRFIASPAYLSAYDAVTDEHFTWSVPPDRLAGWLAVTSSENGIQLGLDREKVSQFLIEKNSELANGRYLDAARFAGEAAESILQHNARPVPVSHSAGEYVVRPGDTLLRIAWNLGFPAWAIINASPGLNPDALVIGSTLVNTISRYPAPVSCGTE